MIREFDDLKKTAQIFRRQRTLLTPHGLIQYSAHVLPWWRVRQVRRSLVLAQRRRQDEDQQVSQRRRQSWQQDTYAVQDCVRCSLNEHSRWERAARRPERSERDADCRQSLEPVCRLRGLRVGGCFVRLWRVVSVAAIACHTERQFEVRQTAALGQTLRHTRRLLRRWRLCAGWRWERKGKDVRRSRHRHKPVCVLGYEQSAWSLDNAARYQTQSIKLN